MTPPPFHLAFPVHDLAAARGFYGGLLGCPEGRSDARWIDFDFFGHQIVAHLVPTGEAPGPTPTPPLKGRGFNAVDGHDVPVPHFGLVLAMDQWRVLADRLVAAGTAFVIVPTVRFEGEPGEQATMFLLDPSGNTIEFKAMREAQNLFLR